MSNKQIITDKTGREIMAGDTLKFYHFTAALRREKHYMYKYVKEQVAADNGEERLIILHLSGDLTSSFTVAIRGQRLNDCEIVQGYAGVKAGQSFKDRPITK